MAGPQRWSGRSYHRVCALAAGLSASVGSVCAVAGGDDRIGPDTLIGGVDAALLADRLSLKVSSRTIMSAGSLFGLEDTGPVGRLLVGVFASPRDAEPSLAWDTWGYVTELFSGLEDPDRPPGPGDLWEPGRGSSLCFRRANVFCHVSLRTADPAAALDLARRIDELLIASPEIAPKGDRVNVPQVEVTLLDPPQMGRRVHVRFDVVDGPPVLWWHGKMSEGPVTTGVMEVGCPTPGDQEVTFWLVTEMNVIANTTFTFTVPAPDTDDDKQ